MSGSGGSAIAQWIHLCLPSCRPGFESQAHHQRFYHLQYLCCICQVKRTKINKKEARFGPFLREKNEDQQVRNKCCQSNQRDSAIRNQEKSDTKLMLKTFLGGNQEFPKSKILNMVCSVMPTQICVVFKRKYAVKQSILLKPIV